MSDSESEFFVALHRLSMVSSIEDCDRRLKEVLRKFGQVGGYALLVRQDDGPLLQVQRNVFWFGHRQLHAVPIHQLAPLCDENTPTLYRVLPLKDLSGQQRASTQAFCSVSADTLVLFQEEGSPYAALVLRGTCQLSHLLFTLLLDTASLVLKHLSDAQQVAFDQLTRLYRRAFFFRRFCSCLRHRPAGPLSVMMIDIDRFKRVNDQHGHAYGDFVLRAICSQIKRSFRKQDLLSRYGGDELAVFLPEATQAQGLVVAQRVLQNVETLKLLHDGSTLTVSIGLRAYCTASPSQPLSPSRLAHQLLSEADDALYRAKRQGRNRVVWQGMPAEPAV